MRSIECSDAYWSELKGKTVIVTGAAGGIGAEAVRLYHRYGAKVVIADLEGMRSSAEALLSSLAEPQRSAFIPSNIVNWADMKHLFRSTKQKFGSVDVVVANAAIMESSPTLASTVLDTDGEPEKPMEAYRVIDTNLKGTLNSKFSCFQG